MTTTATQPARSALEHDEAMHLAEVEYERLLGLVDDLSDDDWTRPTDCTEWDVKAILAHLLGMLERNADKQEAKRQIEAAGEIAQRTGGLLLDALTALQVREHSHLSTAELARALHAAAPRALTARRQTTEEERGLTYLPGLPGEGAWTMGYILDVIHTRDPWIHRVDICRATGREMALTAEHDGRIVADVVAEWAQRHGKPFSLVLAGPAGATFGSAGGGAELRLDAVEFCRILSGRAPGEGLLATRVPF